MFCFKQKTAYEVRISDWSSDVCSSDLRQRLRAAFANAYVGVARQLDVAAQGVACAGAEIGQQAILPAVPQARAGTDDVGNSQQIELAELKSDKYRVGQGCVSTVRSRGAQYS